MAAGTSQGWTPPEEAPEGIRVAIGRFREGVQGDPRVLAAFVGGSFAAGTWDEHSDLDLYVIADDADYDEVFAERVSFIEAMGQVLLAEDFDGFGFDMVVFMLAGGIEGELGLGRASGFTHIHGGPHRVLADREEILEGVEFELARPSAGEQAESVERTVSWFWRHLSLFATAAARGRAWTAFGYLEHARRNALNLVWLLEDPGSWPGGFDGFEDVAGGEQVAAMATTLVGVDLESQRAAAGTLARLVAQDGRAAYQLAGRRYPDRLESTVLDKLDGLERSG